MGPPSAPPNLSRRTVQSYLEAARLLGEYLVAQGMPTDVAAIRREHVESFQLDQLARWKTATAAVRHASLRVFFGWLVEEGEIRESPMARIKKPALDEVLTDIPTRDELTRLLASCEGPDFEDRRDMAILRTFIATGARLAKVASLRWTPAVEATHDLDLDAGIMRVMGKGRRERVSHLNAKAVKAIDRYARVRKAHPSSAEPWLWLGRRGRLGASGISQMVRDRSARLGLAIHPHSFRHFYAQQRRPARQPVPRLGA